MLLWQLSVSMPSEDMYAIERRTGQAHRVCAQMFASARLDPLNATIVTNVLL